MSGLFRKPKAPETPDYSRLAQDQGAENQRAAEQTALLGSPNEVTPWGSIERAYDPTSQQFTYTTSLTPDQQRLFEGGQEIDLSRMNLGKEQIGNISELWSQPFDTSGMTERVTGIDPKNLTTSINKTGYSFDTGSAPDYQSALDLGHLGNRPTLEFGDLPQLPGLGDFGGERQRVEDALYSQHTSRLDPQYQQAEEALRNRLYSQGIREGNPAWSQAFDDFHRQRSGAYTDARNSSITGAGAEQSRLFGMASSARGQAADEVLASAGFSLDARSQGVSEALTQGNFANAVTQLERNYGLDRQAAVNMATQLQNQLELSAGTFENTAAQQGFDQEMANALLANQSRGAELDEAAYLRALPFNEFQAMQSGTEVTPPNFSGPTVAPGVQGAPIYQAGQDEYAAQYNRYAQEMARLNSLWNTIGEVGASLGGAAIAASDRRLKSNIKRIGSLKSGLNVYSYEIFGRPEVGVMAQEAREIFPYAVIEHPSGYLLVNYGAIA